MFLQNLRAKMSARLKGEGEAGFTLIELLVVMLILGILAAIAIPAFFNQRDKGTDAQAKAAVRTAQTAMETFATDNGGQYVDSGGESPDAGDLQTIEPTLNDADLEVISTDPDEYTIQVNSESAEGQYFQIVRAADGTITFPCENKGTAGCPAGEGGWSQ